MKKCIKYTKCEKCGSSSVRIEERVVPVKYSFLDSLGRVLLFLIPVIGWILAISAIISRNHLKEEVIATCSDCGYRKDITKKLSCAAMLLIYFIVSIVAFIVMLGLVKIINH